MAYVIIKYDILFVYFREDQNSQRHSFSVVKLAIFQKSKLNMVSISAKNELLKTRFVKRFGKY